MQVSCKTSGETLTFSIILLQLSIGEPMLDAASELFNFKCTLSTYNFPSLSRIVFSAKKIKHNLWIHISYSVTLKIIQLTSRIPCSSTSETRIELLLTTA